MPRPAVRLLSVILLYHIALSQPAAAQHGSTYLGCFTFSRLLYQKGVEGVKPTQHNKDTIGQCFSRCQERGYSMSIVATDFRCWCAMATPPAQAVADESACEAGSNKGALVFYHYDGASACRVEELAVEPSNFVISPQTAQSKAAFDSLGQSMALNLNGNGVTKATVNFPAQLYGQLEVLARVSVHPGVVTSIDVQDASQPGQQAKGALAEDISWQFFNTTPAGIGKNVLMGTATRAKTAASALDNLMKPVQYKNLAGLKLEENLGNTWVTYTIDWQSDKVTWAMNGVPLLTKRKGELPPTPEFGRAQTAARQLLSTNVKKQEQQQQPKQLQEQPPQQPKQPKQQPKQQQQQPKQLQEQPQQPKQQPKQQQPPKQLQEQPPQQPKQPKQQPKQQQPPKQLREQPQQQPKQPKQQPKQQQPPKQLQQQQRKHPKPGQAQLQQQQQNQQSPPAKQPQQQPWRPPAKPAQLSFSIWWNTKAGSTMPAGQANLHTAAAAATAAQKDPAMKSSFMEVKRIVCDRPRVRGDPGAVVPTWFVLGHGWNQKQQQQQQPKQQSQKRQEQLKKQQQQQKQQQQAWLQDSRGGGGNGSGRRWAKGPPRFPEVVDVTDSIRPGGGYRRGDRGPTPLESVHGRGAGGHHHRDNDRQQHNGGGRRRNDDAAGGGSGGGGGRGGGRDSDCDGYPCPIGKPRSRRDDLDEIEGLEGEPVVALLPRGRPEPVAEQEVEDADSAPAAADGGGDDSREEWPPGSLVLSRDGMEIWAETEREEEEQEDQEEGQEEGDPEAAVEAEQQQEEESSREPQREEEAATAADDSSSDSGAAAQASESNGKWRWTYEDSAAAAADGDGVEGVWSPATL